MNSQMNETPRGERFFIGFFGKRNSGKSSLINCLLDQDASIVSPVAGTTTDPVSKSMELLPIGPCTVIDTAGFDDEGRLGEERIRKTNDVSKKIDLAIIVFDTMNLDQEKKWIEAFRGQDIPVVLVISKSDCRKDGEALQQKVYWEFGQEPILINALNGRQKLLRTIVEKSQASLKEDTILNGLAGPGDLVMLVMPQDIQAPKGRLILPQVQTIRELLDTRAIIVSVTAKDYEKGLEKLSAPPDLIITDSQAFDLVYRLKPKESKLTSFSVLFAAYKGDLPYFVEGVQAIEKLTEESRVLIAECCSHAPMDGDIGRIKIPAMLRKHVGHELNIDIVGGSDFPDNPEEYDLIIQCGGCMFNRRYVMSRVDSCKTKGVPMTNYGVVMAYLTGILENVTLS